MKNLTTMIARTPTYARRQGKWYCSPVFYGEVILSLLAAAGGNTAADLANGIITEKFLNYPVVTSEVFPTTEANSQVPLLFGDLSKSSHFGDREQISFAQSQDAVVNGESVFERNQTAIRGIERFDINNSDLGTETQAGPVVGLVLASS